MTDFNKANFGSPFNGDKIVEILEGSFTYTYTTSSSGGQYQIDNPQVGTKFLPFAIFSTDGGDTWFTDMEGDGINGIVDMLTVVTTTKIKFKWNWYGPSGSKTVLYRLALILIGDPIDILSTSNSTGLSSARQIVKQFGKEQYDSSLVYRRILYNQTLNLTSNQTKTITHDLGYIPYFRAWSELYSDEVSFFYVDSAQYTFGGDYYSASIFGFDITATTTTITINSYSPARPFYLRIYER